MDMIGRIRRLHRRGNKSEREIVRTTGLSRSTAEAKERIKSREQDCETGKPAADQDDI